MRLARLEKQCRRLLAGIDVPRPFDLSLFCSYVSARRGRDLHLHPLPVGYADGAPCGLWLGTDRADHVFYATGTGPLHQQHIILHEIGHVLCDHVAPGLTQDDAMALLLPDIDAGTIGRVLRRSTYTAPQEQVAEMVATIINERAAGGYARPPADPTLGNLHEALADPSWIDRP
jgi:hypothetical protein